MDFYRKMLNHFKWTWLEHKFCRWHRKAPKKEQVATKLARAYAKREVRKQINEEIK